MLKFLVHIEDFEISSLNSTKQKFKQLDSSTSVNKLKLDFYTLLAKIGELIQIDNTFLKSDIETLCRGENVIYTAVNGNPPEGVECKFLSHSLGGFMLTGGFLGGWEFRNATINIVTSELQAMQMRNSLKKACPNISVITPSISTETFRIPYENEKSSIKNKEVFDLIYAGRFISNKGIIQLVRALNIWPINKTELTLVGDFEPDFFIYNSNACHTTFQDYFSREILERSPNLKINIHSSVTSEQLKDFYWNASCFVYPSFHEDENFGLAPREAMLCGIPSIVTDFCGLGQLGVSKGGIVKTYPSLGGVRFSLFELRIEIQKVKKWSQKERLDNMNFNISFVKEECKEKKSLDSLYRSVYKLNETKLDNATLSGWRSKKRFENLVEKNPSFFKKSIENRNKPYPNGLYADGTGSTNEGKWFSEPYFMQAIQSIYTTLNEAPKVKSGECYRGFWRIALWEQEQSIVEFGFPGPRFKKLNKKEWIDLVESSYCQKDTEVVFYPISTNQVKLIQELVGLGYLVPDKI